MIVPMKKISVLCLSDEKRRAVASLAKLGVLHVAQTELKESEDRSRVAKSLEFAQKSLSIISSSKGRDMSPPDLQVTTMSAIAKANMAISFSEQSANLAKELASVNSKIEKLSAWGEFNPADVANLKDKGIFVYFCEKNSNDDFAAPDGAVMHMVSEGGGRTLFVLVSFGALDESKLPLAELDRSKSLSELMAERESVEAKISSLNAKIAGMRIFAKEIKDSMAGLKTRLDIASAVDSMKGGGSLSCLTGYIPAGDEPALREAAKQNGWGLVIEDAALDDRLVPTKIEIPKIFRIVRPVFEFIGIEPGYDEVDVSVCFLFFFSIFFAMLIGDAGYGCLFLAAAIFAKFKFGWKEEMRTPLNLFTVLSVCTIVWGALCGSWFSINSSMLPAPMRGLKSLADPAVKDKTVQTFCFLLAALHLSAGRIWRAILLSNRKSLGQIGWLLMIWMNFFLIKGLLVDGGILKTGIIIALLGISLVLLVIFYVDWKNLGDIFNFPFAIIGSFSDVLSYIRLYAVGLASYYLAVNVNQIGAMFFDSKIFFVVGLLIILFGHALNITLCLLGVLVHGIRLNALEFSNHMELQWKGLKYQPLKMNGLPEIQRANCKTPDAQARPSIFTPIFRKIGVEGHALDTYEITCCHAREKSFAITSQQ